MPQPHALLRRNFSPQADDANQLGKLVADMISVCMAVHNGEKFVEAQLQSILAQLGNNDEIVVVDDASTDHTSELLGNFKDARLRILTSRKNVGVLKSFEKALREARGDFIFFSDQDDLWLPGKVNKVLEEFVKTGAHAIVTDAVVVGDDGKTLYNSYFAWRGSGPGFLKNFYKNTFLGCCMAIRQECRGFLLPFPPLTYMHDQWMGLACSIVGQVGFLPEPLLIYRRHQWTLTRMQRSAWWWVCKSRLLLFFSLLYAFPRLMTWRIRLSAG